LFTLFVIIIIASREWWVSKEAPLYSIFIAWIPFSCCCALWMCYKKGWKLPSYNQGKHPDRVESMLKERESRMREVRRIYNDKELRSYLHDLPPAVLDEIGQYVMYI